MTRVGIAGAGAWGLALALAAKRAGSDPILWSRRGPFTAEDLSVAGDPAVRRAVADSMATQDSPLVQVALIDLLAQLNDKGAVGALQKLSQDKNVDPEVRQRAVSAAEKLGQ